MNKSLMNSLDQWTTNIVALLIIQNGMVCHRFYSSLVAGVSLFNPPTPKGNLGLNIPHVVVMLIIQNIISMLGFSMPGQSICTPVPFSTRVLNLSARYPIHQLPAEINKRMHYSALNISNINHLK